MSRELTAAQTEAVFDESGNILVSAGAGSGKTFALTERIVQYLLRHPEADLSRLLVVTFTKKAASELKGRIEKRLQEELEKAEDKKALYAQLLSIDRATISTIHSFCLSILRMKASAIGLAPDFSIADDADVKIMIRESMEATVDLSFAKEQEKTDEEASFEELASALGSTRDQTKIDEDLLAILTKIREKGFSPSHLRTFANMRDDQGKAGGFSGIDEMTCRESLLSFASFYSLFFEKMASGFQEDEFFKKKHAADAFELHELADRLVTLAREGSYEELQSFLHQFAISNCPNTPTEQKCDEYNVYPTEREHFRKGIQEYASSLFSFSVDQIAKDAHQLARYERALASVYELFLQKYNEEKQKKGVLDFADLEIEALHLLEESDHSPSPFAQEVSLMYDQIFVDEYQDTNHIQDAIFRSIERNHNRFFVGDIKQSIYQFRGAEPTIFSNYRKQWAASEENAGHRTISMSENFRCNKPIIDFSNQVSDTIFPASPLAYTAEDRLIAAKTHEDNEIDIEHPVTLQLFGSDNKEDEYEYVADAISSLLQNGRKNNGERYSPSDIAILLRSPTTHADPFIRALQRRNIPTRRKTALDFFSQPEIQLTLCLLETINNPTKDIFLSGYLKSPLGHFSLEDLTKVRKVSREGSLWDALRYYSAQGEEEELREKCDEMQKKIEMYRSIARSMPSDKLIQYLFADTDVTTIASHHRSNPEQIQHHLQTLYELARQYELGAFEGLYGFLRRLHDLESNENTSFSLPGSETDGVQILSVHDSKGLEFPAVFLCHTGAKFNLKDCSDPVLLDNDLGISMRLPDSSYTLHVETWQRLVMAERIKQRTKEEEMRILYVALTRACEQLTVTGSLSNKNDTPASYRVLTNLSLQGNTQEKILPKYLLQRSPNLLTWLMLSYGTNPYAPYLSFQYVINHGEEMTEQGGIATPLPDTTTEEISPDDLAKIQSRLLFQYPNLPLTKVPAKMVVSRLHPTLLDKDEETPSLDLSSGTKGLRDNLIPLPQFMSEMPAHLAAEKGTATHAFLQFCDLKQLRAPHGIENEMQRLISGHFITDKMATLIDQATIEAFVHSKVYDRLLKAAKVHKEYRFYTNISAEEFTSDEKQKAYYQAQGTKVMVQGVIDCFFVEPLENGKENYVLIDYKTDHFSKDELKNPEHVAQLLRERHKDQLYYYKLACEQLFQTSIQDIYIYSFALGDCVEAFPANDS